MKGLILKDLYMSAKYFRNYLLILLIFVGVSFVQEDSLFFAFYPFLLCGMIPVNLLAYDERAHWDIYCGTLPVTRDMVVSAKYIIGLMLQGVVFLVSAIGQAVRFSRGGSFDAESYLVLMSLMAMLSLFSSSITLPFMFKLGVEKGRMAYYVMIFVICGGAGVAGFAFNEQLQATIPFGTVLALGVALAAAVYAGSWWLSILFYRKRELH